MAKKLYFLPLFLLGLSLVACNAVVASPQLSSTEFIELTPSKVNPTGTKIPPSPTFIPPIAASTITATSTSLPTASATPTPPHPLTIAWLRQQEYPGSDIVIEEILNPGANYDRYIASYISEGLKIYALLTVPIGERPANGWPVIVFNHGYIPPDQYRTTERYVDYVDAFATRGYIVFRPDYRGHGNSEGVARGGYGTPDYTIDVLNAVATIKNYPDADPESMGMWGHSMGGYITLRSMVATDDIRAGVIWAGVVASYEDLLSRWRRRGSSATPSVPTRARRWREDISETYGFPEENPQFWASISANSYLEDLSGPLQLHHGTADQSVPIEFSARLYEQVQDAGGTVEYFAYEGDNHNISNKFSEAMFRSIVFFDKFVKGSSP